MGKYSDGTISIAVGSDLVDGDGTDFISNVAVGDGMTIPGIATGFYVKAILSPTRLQLDKVITGRAGNAMSKLNYVTNSHFTPVLGMPFPEPNDVKPFELVRRSIEILDLEIRSP